MLVVDDNQDAADCLTALVRMWGHDACTAYEGLSALDLARSFGPQIVLLDISMPGMDGWEVARRLRQEHGRTPTIVATTGLGQDDDRKRSREAGFDAHWVKPIDLEALKRLLSGPADSGNRSASSSGEGGRSLDLRSAYPQRLGDIAVAGC